MLSKVLTWLGDSGGSKQEGCRGCGKDLFVSRVVTGHLCPAFLPWHNFYVFPTCFGKG